jgi:hypothetical protein
MCQEEVPGGIGGFRGVSSTACVERELWVVSHDICGHFAERRGEPVIAHGLARRVIEGIWDSSFTFGVVETALKRPGRGRSPGASNVKGWRYEERRSELDRFNKFVGGLIEGLRCDIFNATAASQKIDQAGYSGFLFVSDSKEQMVKIFSDRLNAGDNAWVEGYTEPGLPGHRVLHLRCWHDPSHERVV